MSSHIQKTPVSILNEFGFKMGHLPQFKVISQSMGTCNPSFKCIVDFLGKCVMGCGRSKQEAKHAAAKEMLELLQISSNDCSKKSNYEELIVPHENVIAYNAVGSLCDYCKKFCHPLPEYEDVNEVGPPHARVFTVMCRVSQLSTTGTARTKKQAKQIAAQMMINKLQSDDGQDPMALAVPKSVMVEEDVQIELDPVGNNTVYLPQAFKYKDYCNAYLNLHESSATVASILKGDTTITDENAAYYLSEISKELAVPVVVEGVDKSGNVQELPQCVLLNNYGSDCSGSHFIMLTLQVNPPVVGIGDDIYVASHCLLKHLHGLCQ